MENNISEELHQLKQENIGYYLTYTTPHYKSLTLKSWKVKEGMGLLRPTAKDVYEDKTTYLFAYKEQSTR